MWRAYLETSRRARRVALLAQSATASKMCGKAFASSVGVSVLFGMDVLAAAQFMVVRVVVGVMMVWFVLHRGLYSPLYGASIRA
jgi:hypothetical protein